MIALWFDRRPPTHPHIVHYFTHTITFNRTVGNSDCSGGETSRVSNHPVMGARELLIPRCGGVRWRFYTLPFVLWSGRSFYFNTIYSRQSQYTLYREYRYRYCYCKHHLRTIPHQPTSSQPLHNHIYAVEYQTVPRSYNRVYQLCIGAIYIYIYIKHFPSVR